MKKIFFTLMCLGISYYATAQLTTGNATSTNLRTGNRAQAGDFGLYIGASSELIKTVALSDLSSDDVSVDILPLVNLKYMYSDQLEWRVGIDLNKSSKSVNGEVEVENKDIKVEAKETHVNHAIYPGFAYHFSKSNILDVYAGAELPLGYERSNIMSKYDEAYTTVSKFAYNIGVGGFIGLQAYIANLPIAVGLEYGIFSRFDLGLKYKMEAKASNNSDTVVRYVADLDGIGGNYNGQYTSLSAIKGSVGSQLRLTLSYFFK